MSYQDFATTNKIIRNSLKEILIYYGAKPSKNGNWDCPRTSYHHNPQGDLSYNGKTCVCHCGLSGDSFKTIAMMEGLNHRDKEDFKKITKIAMDILNLTREEYQQKANEEKKEAKKELFLDEKTKQLLTNTINNYFDNTKKYKKDYEYFFKRGLTNDIIKANKIIVENPVKLFKGELIKHLPSVKNIWSYRYIIPIWENNKVINILLRRDDNLSTKGIKILNLKNIPLGFYNIDKIKKVSNENIFICEGFFDAITIERYGHISLSINSTNLIYKFMAKIEKFNIENCNFYICFDNDSTKKHNWGQIWAKKLIKELKKKGFNSKTIVIKDYNDLNDYYLNDYTKFKESLNKITS